jgi:hypothetical protein
MSYTDKQKQTTPEQTSFIIDGIEYVFNTFWIEKLKTVNTEVTKEYIKSIKLADIMHDIDYIGFSTENHNVIAGLIYNENCALVKTHTEFNLLRAKFLIDLLLNGELFISKYFFKYNNIAYKNIKAEIQHLIK